MTEAVRQQSPESTPPRRPRRRIRALLALFAGAGAGYLLVLQLTSPNNNPLASLARARPEWLALALLCAVGGLVAATMSYIGFVPERLDPVRSFLLQVAGGFANVVTPGGVGGLAISTRFLQRVGIPPGQALSSIGVSQAVGLVLHLMLTGVFGYLASVRYRPSTQTSPLVTDTVIGVVAAVALVALVAVGVPRLRRRLTGLVRPLLEGVLPRLRELLHQPGKLAVGVAGQLLVSLAAAGCLYCCLLALGRDPGFAAVALANLVGGALGSTVPTPGGIGGVEVVLAGAVAQTAGLPYHDALVAVLLYRLLTLWLPVLPGWLAFVWLQRHEKL
ncbi:lysylphosphatidylglycerol synthase transmembrane domain-containing protein [Streptacidiphilus carbonis]|uniref:lysylphosphatidylglycerol synthase transmembrane domain-containing protein n=1 Tax=Streptacidiphilus carbonis TaxID=105422 RepID=UPI000A057B11|nr:lysylphosphatidylglycerol synthase transmembrane domain-containing protein [Streptacidiphilus carbonis]